MAGDLNQQSGVGSDQENLARSSWRSSKSKNVFFTPEEEKVMKEMKNHHFWTRIVPSWIIGGAYASHKMSKGSWKPANLYGRLGYVCGTIFVTHSIATVSSAITSYKVLCKMDGNVGRAYRNEPLLPPPGEDNSLTATPSGTIDITNDQFGRLINAPPAETQPEKGDTLVTYDELRRKNREKNGQQQINPPPVRQARPPPVYPPIAKPKPSAGGEPKNDYGDAWSSE